MTSFAKFEVRGAVHVAGSTTIRGPMQLAAEAFMTEQPGMIVTVSGGGTTRGIRGVVGGTLQLAMASADISAEERKLAAKHGLSLTAHILGHDAIVPIVHPANPVHGLTVEELAGIFSGEFTNWKDVGGPDLPIVVLSDVPQAGTAEAWHALVLHTETLTPKATILDAMPLRRKVAEAPGAIGYVAHTQLTAGVKSLTVDGVAVGTQAIRDGRYPLRRSFSLVSTANPSKPAQDFIDYMRNPAKGQAILAAAGNVPLSQGTP